VQAERRSLSEPWGRLAWILPVALVLTTVGLAGFLELLVGRTSPLPTPNTVSLQVVELSPEPQVETPPTLETPPPTSDEPPPVPPVKPTPAIATAPPTPVQPPPPPSAKPTPAIEVPSPTPVEPLPLPPLPPPARPPRRENAPAPPLKSNTSATPPIHRNLTRAPQQPVALSTESARPAPRTRSSMDSVTMGARVLYRPMPDIPEELRHRELAIAALARFHVAADGSASVTLLQATADPILNANLMSTLRKWRFFPAMENGRPIASTLDIRIPIEVK
jgi:periplasmic protein TonB